MPQDNKKVIKSYPPRVRGVSDVMLVSLVLSLSRIMGHRCLLGIGMWLFFHEYYRASRAAFCRLPQLAHSGMSLAAMAYSCWALDTRFIPRDLFAKALEREDARGFVAMSFASVLRDHPEATRPMREEAQRLYSIARQAFAREGNAKKERECLLEIALCSYPDRPDEAEGLVDQLIKADPDWMEAVYYRALMCAFKQDWSAAKEGFSKAIVLSPRNANSHYELGNALCYCDRLTEADYHFEKAIAYRTMHIGRAWYGRAYCAFFQHRYRDARRFTMRALKIKPEYDDARELLNELEEIESGSGRVNEP